MIRNYVKSRLSCRHGQSIDLCVPVEREVPPPLRCSPGGGSLGGGQWSLCAVCTRLLKDSLVLRELVNDQTRRGWGDHIRAGAVVIGC